MRTFSITTLFLRAHVILEESSYSAFAFAVAGVHKAKIYGFFDGHCACFQFLDFLLIAWEQWSFFPSARTGCVRSSVSLLFWLPVSESHGQMEAYILQKSHSLIVSDCSYRVDVRFEVSL